MTLTIGALSLNDQPLSQPYVAHFDAAGGTIGRDEHNTLMLPDPQRHISRQHARISADGAAYRITNLSGSNIVTVAGRSLSAGESAPIHHRDQVRIGGFLLEVIENCHALAAEAPAAVARTITAGRAALSASIAIDTGARQVLANAALLHAGAAAGVRAAAGPFAGLARLQTAQPRAAAARSANAGTAGPSAPTAAPAAAPDPALWQAFCDAAGVQIDLPQGLGPAEMRTIGQLLRAAVDGTVLLLAGRTPPHHARCAEPAPTEPPNNNPLDLASGGQDALELLLQPPQRGYMPAPAAMADAMQSLISHQAGQAAARRAALEGTFDPFAPAELETRHRADLAVRMLLPVSRRSRLWSHYVAEFDTLCRQARDELQARCDQAYLSACDQELDRRQGADLVDGLQDLPAPAPFGDTRRPGSIAARLQR